MKDWLKKNWTIVLLVAIIGCLITNNVVDSISYKRDIRAGSDSIAILKYQYQELEKRAGLSAELVDAYEFAFTAYQDSLQDTRIKLITQNKRHAKQVADLIRIPSDVLYIDYTRWIDTVSFER